MKKITCMVLMAVALLLATPAQAQFSWGVKGGVNLGNNDLMALKDKSCALDVSNYTGFFIGPKAELRIPILGFGVEAAAMYGQNGMSIGNNETFKQNSFLIPLNLKYIFGLGNIANIFVAAGPEFGFNIGDTQKFVSSLNEEKTSGGVQGYVTKRSTLAINVGIGATLINHLQVSINYNMPWGKTGEFVYIEASEIEDVEKVKNGEKITSGDIVTLAGTAEKAKSAYSNIKSGTIQLSVAYLF